jgi:hypothetical protein
MRPSASGSPSREGFFELQLVGEKRGGPVARQATVKQRKLVSLLGRLLPLIATTLQVRGTDYGSSFGFAIER